MRSSPPWRFDLPSPRGESNRRDSFVLPCPDRAVDLSEVASGATQDAARHNLSERSAHVPAMLASGARQADRVSVEDKDMTSSYLRCAPSDKHAEARQSRPSWRRLVLASSLRDALLEAYLMLQTALRKSTSEDVRGGETSVVSLGAREVCAEGVRNPAPTVTRLRAASPIGRCGEVPEPGGRACPSTSSLLDARQDS